MEQIGEQQYYPDTWKEIGNFNRDIGAVREYLREGDCTDMYISTDGTDFHAHSLTQVIRSQEAIIVPVINIKNDGGISDIGCGLGENLHWKLDPHTVDTIVVTIPTDFGKVVDTFEVRNGAIIKAQFDLEQVSLGKDYHGNELRTITASLSAVAMTPDLSTRLFVLANSADVRSDVQKKLGGI